MATLAGISKRTLYARNRDKAALFQAAVARMIRRWSPTLTVDVSPAGVLSETLTRAATEVLSVALTPEALALSRILLSEGGRFPELSAAMRDAGAQSGATRIGVVLAGAIAAGELRPMHPVEAAQRFMALVVTAPQQAAMSGLPRIDPERWARDSVALFLDGARGQATASEASAPAASTRSGGASVKDSSIVDAPVTAQATDVCSDPRSSARPLA